MDKEQDIIDALVDGWITAVEPHTRVNACILAARVTSLVLDYYNITNRVIACETFVFNQAAIKQLELNTPTGEWPPEAWSIGVTSDSPGGEYGGHLIVKTDELLIDLSARQFHRPGRISINGPRVWDEVFVTDDGRYMVNEDDVWVMYVPATHLAPYRNTPDWRNGKPVAARFIREINTRRAHP